MIDRTYCLVPGCDEQPRPDEDICDTHQQEDFGISLSSRYCRAIGHAPKSFFHGWYCERCGKPLTNKEAQAIHAENMKPSQT